MNEEKHSEDKSKKTYAGAENAETQLEGFSERDCFSGRAILKKLAVFFSVAAAAAVGIIASTLIFGTVCPIKGLTGFPCPGCGMTRAWAAVFRGEPAEAFKNHPLWPIAPFFICGIIIYTLAPRIKPRVWKSVEIFLFTCCALFTAAYVIRIALGWRG